MDDWLIFQYHFIRDKAESEVLREPFGATDPLGTRPAMGGRRRVGRPRRWLSWGKCVGGLPRQIREVIHPETRHRAASGEATDPMLPRKSSSELMRCPHPKPTQVGKWRTLRRSSEPWLRNSANCIRNFGRRMTAVG